MERVRDQVVLFILHTRNVSTVRLDTLSCFPSSFSFSFFELVHLAACVCMYVYIIIHFNMNEMSMSWFLCCAVCSWFSSLLYASKRAISIWMKHIETYWNNYIHCSQFHTTTTAIAIAIWIVFVGRCCCCWCFLSVTQLKSRVVSSQSSRWKWSHSIWTNTEISFTKQQQRIT